jgi:hypothetical protein
MKTETIFIRDNDKAYSEPCDVAHVPLIRSQGGQGGPARAYLGMRLGVHTPSDCVAWGHVAARDAWTWVEAQGYKGIPDQGELQEAPRKGKTKKRTLKSQRKSGS